MEHGECPLVEGKIPELSASYIKIMSNIIEKILTDAALRSGTQVERIALSDEGEDTEFDPWT
jgi:hypothetical protein